jgi:hypothetical protein
LGNNELDDGANIDVMSEKVNTDKICTGLIRALKKIKVSENNLRIINNM